MSKKKRTVVKYTDDKGNKIKSVERRSGKRVETIKSKDGNYKSRQVTGKDGKVKNTVTRTPGGVEKEIERGNKRIEVRKYKDEGVKTRTVTNMKKNNQYKENSNKALKQTIDNFMSDLKASSFKNVPKQMYDNANSSQNTQIDGKISESKPLTTPQKKLMNIPIAAAEGALSGLGIKKKKD